MSLRSLLAFLADALPTFEELDRSKAPHLGQPAYRPVPPVVAPPDAYPVVAAPRAQTAPGEPSSP